MCVKCVLKLCYTEDTSQSPSRDRTRDLLGLVYTACYERTELIIYVARSGTLVAIFDLYVTTVSEPNLLFEKLNMF